MSISSAAAVSLSGSRWVRTDANLRNLREDRRLDLLGDVVGLLERRARRAA